jgi:hypothetical protein
MKGSKENKREVIVAKEAKAGMPASVSDAFPEALAGALNKT